MTNITELAQRMKAAAVRAKTATEEYASGHVSVSVCFAECEEFNRLAFTEKHEISNMHATGLYLRAWPADRARNSVEGYTIPLYTTPQPISLVNSEPVAYIFKHPAGRLFWALTDESNKGQNDVMPVYASPQPAPVVPDDVLAALQKVARIRLDMNDFDGDRRGIADCLGDAEEALIEVVYRRAAMLQAEPVCTCPSGNGSLRWPCPVHAGSSPVIPDGYVLVPMRLTAENGAKGALSGEFSETKFLNCPECFGDDECETCDGSGKIEITVPVTWTTIKAIWVKGVEHFAVTAQEND